MEQGVVIQHLESKKIDPGTISFTNHHTVMILFIPGLEIDPALIIPAGFQQAQHIPIEMNALFEIQHPDLSMTRPQYTLNRHQLIPLVIVYQLDD